MVHAVQVCCDASAQQWQQQLAAEVLSNCCIRDVAKELKATSACGCGTCGCGLTEGSGTDTVAELYNKQARRVR
jgi:hypothetical protein